MQLLNSKFNNLVVLKKLIFVAFLIIISSFSIKVKAQQTAQRDENGRGYLEYLPPGYNDNSDLYPVIVFLHGQGERGNGSPGDLEKVKRHGPPKHIKNGHNMCFEYNGVEECFIVLSPQISGYNFWAPDVMEFVQTALGNYRIDPERIHLMGISMGGIGVWRTAYSDENEDNIFAALSVAPGKGEFEDACKIAENKTPVWAFHGTNDNSSMPIYAGRRPIEGMIACDADPAPIFTVYEGVGHNSWDRAYRTDNSLHTPNIYQWFLAQTKGGGGTSNNNPPSAPNDLSSNFTGTNKIKLNWSDNSNNETNFFIERSLNSNSNFNIIKTTNSNTTSYEDNNLNPNTQYYYRIRAKNNDGYSPYSNKLSVKTEEDLPNEPQNVTIIDNKHSSVTKTGNWISSTFGGSDKYEQDYFHDGNTQKGEKSIVFKANLNPGTYEVYARWYSTDRRSTKTPFDIKTTQGNITVYENQQLNSGRWVSLGKYDFGNLAEVIVRNDDTDGYVIADAIKFEPVLAGNLAPGEEIVLDNQDAGVNQNGNWISSTFGGSDKYEQDYFHDGNTQKGEKSIVFSATVNPGNYEVYAQWYSTDRRSTNTPFEIITTQGSKIVYENQQLNSGEWVSLGSYDFGNMAEVIVRNDNTDGYVIADAIKLVYVGAGNIAPPVEIILDNQDAGVNQNGNWISSTFGGSDKYAQDYFHDGNTQKGEKSIVFSANVIPGTYEVYARWYSTDRRSTKTPFDLKTTQGSITVYENQQLNSGEWVSLGSYDFGNKAEVIVRNDNTDGYVIADAIKLIPNYNNTMADNSMPANSTEELKMVTIDDITVYPNPLQNSFSIRSPFEETKVFSIKMRSKTGRIEWEQSKEGEGEIRFDINRANINPGIKYLSIEVAGQPIKVLQILLL